MATVCREFSCGSNEGFHEIIHRVFEDYIGAKVIMGRRESFNPLSHFPKSFYYRAALCVGEPCSDGVIVGTAAKTILFTLFATFLGG